MKVPLMKERTSGERLCVNCDTTYVPDGQGLRPAVRPSQNQAGAEQPQLRQQPEQNESALGGGDLLDEYDPRADARLGPFASAGQAGTSSAPDGELGIGMVGEAKTDGSLSSVAAASTVASSRNDGAESATVTARGPGRTDASSPRTRTTTPGAPAASRSAAAAAADTSPSDIADLLAAKMLQGWALLDKHCPRCNTVLVRSKVNKRMFCVACDAWVLTEADSQKQQQQQGEKQAEEGPQEEDKSLAVAPAAVPAAAPVPQPAAAAVCVSTARQSQQGPPALPPQENPQHDWHRQGVAFLPQHHYNHEQKNMHMHVQLPPMYEHFLTSTAPEVPGGGAGSSSRGSSPPQGVQGGYPSTSHEARAGSLGTPAQHQHQDQQRQYRCQQPQHEGPRRQAPSTGHAEAQGTTGYNGPSTGAGTSNSDSTSRQPNGTALLLSIGSTVSRKLSEAQGLLERTSVLDTERVRSYVALISDCLDLLSKLHSLQQKG
ncbi:hypothetical protein VOLCADRAFT_106102 [Volvox carteri f. nagariensis]|uniref:Uncharacterized protein n=1 Tax=Volvox carteri f. nagariensis TaxID=3068 RepID=D8U529_VOLCA|nr:uncharacterized protein VOLCADRAFT_106102 [Volvox carteri f. nagariensis]EFJ45145.1 hypothetical protein VOLCADRAFT_106102 [Volvox carteri f. nagariensis]|eukprot:XP_002953821.1 hypothetical protein VOLCADRAFT_106102 [Volvox carteri f. nagariensis]